MNFLDEFLFNDEEDRLRFINKKKKFLKIKEKLRGLKMNFAKLESAFNKVPVFSKIMEKE
jgi:hypothetical protein